ncbi:MAG: Hsp70 family protein, partial [Anaerolineae bacterium]|nr:Hsp70 family protein [Anaerolineae bacterium]
APRGVPQIEVTFDIDANGILNVSAQDKATGREQSITITASSGLSEQEIQRMVHEAQEHASEDTKRRETVETRNQAETSIHAAEKTLRDFGDKIPADAKQKTEERIEAVRKALEGTDTDTIRREMESLSQQLQTIGESMYQQQQQQPGDGQTPPPPPPGGDASGEDVIDGEFTEA